MDAITVLIVTYNSAATIEDTLESVYNQSYPAVELVITDDGSKDSTMSVCERWIEEHRQRFVRIEFVRSPVNTGISSNVNRGFKACRTEWVKSIAADDILLPNYLTMMIEQTKIQPDVRFFFSKIAVFGTYEVNDSHTNVFWEQCYEVLRRPYTARQQYIYLRYVANILPAATAFLHLDTIRSVGYADETILFLEDYPLWLKATRNGFRLGFVDQVTTQYRVSDSSIQSNSKFRLSIFLATDKYRFGNIFHSLLARNIDQMYPENPKNRWWILGLKITQFPARIWFRINLLMFRRLCKSRSL